MNPPRAPRVRRRLSRTLSRSRWGEYRRLLEAARAHDYQLVPLETWIRSGSSGSGRELIMRHDVDQHPRSALAMAAIEEALGVSSTWYFRWRTASPAVIRSLRSRGFQVGLHYETLTRRTLSEGTQPDGPGALAEARSVLREEIAAFARLFGPIASVAPHGDSRMPTVTNAVLLRGERAKNYGIEFDGNEAMRGRGLACWLTDRSSAEGGWKDEVDPLQLFRQEVTPILCLTHPNNWASGPSLWLDRALTLAPAGSAGQRLIRTGSDLPPL